MADTIRIVLGPSPGDSRVERNGELVTNVLGVKVEQASPLERPRVELTIFGAEVTVEVPASNVLTRSLCPGCRREMVPDAEPADG